MCGIAGKVYEAPQRPVDEALLRRMCAAMAHRGPDDEGVHLSPPAGLGMRRLQVIDLEGGHQPMANEDGRLWVVFNGEIYNYRTLRRDLEARGHTFATASDTEVIVHLFEDHGVDAFGHLEGMFAIAVWDEDTRQLVLARDRLGKKPLYYARADGGLTFGSELSVVLQDPAVPRELDETAIDRYLSLLFVPQPLTAYRHVRKLPAGCHAVYENGGLQVCRYWDLPPASQAAAPDVAAAEATLDELLNAAVRDRLAADVPLGAFLSGGLDSSLIAACMCRHAGRVRTFAIGFEEGSFNELAYARQVAEALGTEHEEFSVSYDVQDLVPDLVDHFGEPFADSSAIPAYHLSRMTRRHVTVALSGDGGDEVFGGYRRYTAWLWADLYRRWTPAGLRRLAEAVARSVPEPDVYYGGSLRKRARRFLEFSAAAEERPDASWAFFFLAAEKRALYTEDFTRRLASDAAADPSLPAPPTAVRSPDDLMAIDLASYLPDDILAKVDRTSMACSLEVRSPFLDRRVVEFARGLPTAWKVTRRERKILLRRVARRYLPDAIVDRPKQGFAIPLGGWLRGPLRPWMHDLLGAGGLADRGWFRPAALTGLMADHEGGRRDLSQQLWALMVLEMWLRRSAAR